MSDGSTYSGHWEHGLRHGFGTSNHVNGDIYKGEWSQGMKHGKGQLTRIDGTSLTGTFEYDKPSGVIVEQMVVDGTMIQDLIVYKRGIKVAQDDSKGLNCQDLFLMVLFFLGFPLTFIYLPFHLAEEYIPAE